MPGPRHGWLVGKVGDQAFEIINQARTAAYLANEDITIDGIDICSILAYGGAETYTFMPTCVGEQGGWVDLPGVAGNYMSAPDAAALDIVGDLTLVAKITPDDWTPATVMTIVSKFLGTGNQRSYRLDLNTTGNLVLTWSTNGTDTPAATSTTSITAAVGASKYVAVTLDVNDGAGGRDVRFWVSDYGSIWTQLGATVHTASTTSIFNSTATLNIGAHTAGASLPFAGLIEHVSVRSGIGAAGVVGGSEVFRVSRTSFQGVASNAPSMTADTGQTITVSYSGGSPTVIVAYLPQYESWLPLTFDTPATDDAPWWNPDYPASADALGFWIEEWTGLDDRHVTRAMTHTGRDRGGAAPGVISNRERVMKLNILLFANSEDGMMYLFRWFAALLESVCSSCSSNSILIRDYAGSASEPQEGVVEMRDVVLVEGMGWEADIVKQGSCFLRRASFTLAAGDPCMYLPDVSPVVTPTNATLGASLLTAAYSATRSPARPSCSELPSGTRQVYSWDAESAMGAKAPVITFQNNNAEYAFPFRAIVYQDPGGVGVSPNPCGMLRLGEIYLRPMPPYSFMRWDVAGRTIEYKDPTTGDWVESWFLLEVNDEPIPRYFTLPCGGKHHLVLEPGTLQMTRIGGSGNVFDVDGTVLSNPHYPSVEIAVQERISCA